MEHFFHKYVRGWHQEIKKLEKHIPHREVIAKFFESKNARLAIILIIAAAIPLTVLGVQQIQDIRQNAASARPCTAEEVSVTTVGEVQKVTFTGNGVNPATHGFGNNVDDKSCEDGDGTVTCTAKGNFRKEIKINGQSQKPKKYQTVNESTSTWFKIDSGTEEPVCQYTITKPAEPTKKPKDPNKPTPTKKPRDPNKEPNEAKCEGNLTASACTADNKPRLSASWNMDGDKCVVKLNGKEISTKCSSENTLITADLKSDTSYDLSISDATGKCNKRADTETTAKCSAGGPTQKPGTTTGPTQKADSTNLEKPKLENHKCNYTDPNNIKVKLTWSGNNNIKDVTYKVEYSPNGETTTTDKKEETVENIKTGTKYKYKVTATKTGATSQTSENSFDCPAPTPTRVPGTPIPTKPPEVPGGDDIFKNCQNSARMTGGKCLDGNGKDCPTTFCP